jgi:hypothetical protein
LDQARYINNNELAKAEPTKKRAPILAVCAMLSTAPLHADVRLPSIFSDHLILLKADKVPVWGKADSGEKVAVSLNGRKWEAAAGIGAAFTPDQGMKTSFTAARCEARFNSPKSTTPMVTR